MMRTSVMRWRRIWLPASFLVMTAWFPQAPLAALPQAPPSCSIAVINAPAGPVCGFQSNVTSAWAYAYLGLPYAQAPTQENHLRWKNPAPLAPWTTLRQATQYGNICPQTAIFDSDPGKRCVFSTNQGSQSEDCLYLNVWAPIDATPGSKLPVMVFIPGGAYHLGSGGATTSSNLYDGTYLAKSGNVIVVTINYRLGVLGFLATPDMQSGGGNFGFRDQLMALRWVQQNVASFGGDPSQVTLFGESAGAISVGLHALSSPQSAGLFKAAIMESNTLGLPYRTLQQAHALGARFSELLDCHELKCLERRTACELTAWETSPCLKKMGQVSLLNVFMDWTPVIDGSLITDQPMANAANLKVPMLMGTNQTEGVFFADKMTQGVGNACTDTPQPYYAAVKDYQTLIDGMFGEQHSRQILKNPRYNCAAAPCTSQLANVITDYIFTCASRDLATRAGRAQNLYMYLFDQITSFNVWGPSAPACQGQVCHGAEIPYVFNTAWAVDQAFQPAEETLSRKMGQHWVSFAKSQSPGSDWPLFDPNKKTYRLLNEISSTADDPLNTAAHCATLWDSIGYQNSAAWKRGE
jgi:carboxylesterase type B